MASQSRYVYRYLSMLLAGVIAAALLPPAAPAYAVSFTVTRLDDLARGACAPGDCTLREAIMAANARPPGEGVHTIILPAGTIELTIAGRDENAGATGDLDILRPMLLQGAGADRTVVDARGIDRVFEVGSQVAPVFFNGLTIQGGDVPAPAHVNPCFFTCPLVSAGGGIFNRGGLSLRRVEVRANRALVGGGIGQDSFGAPITGQASLTLTESTVAENHASQSGGGVVADRSSVRVTESTISRNQAALNAGGIGMVFGQLVIEESTIAENTAGDVGDAINNSGSVNAASVRASIIDRPERPGAEACSGPFTSQGHNVVRDASCGLTGPGDQTGRDPRLATLRRWAGPTRTHSLFVDSPALDVATLDCLPTDQRGTARPKDGNGDGRVGCDAGAVEMDRELDYADLRLTITDDRETIRPNDSILYRMVARNNGPARVSNVRVSYLFPGELVDRTWSCAPTPGSRCLRSSGSGDVQVFVDLAPGGEAVIAASGTVRGTASGILNSTVRMSADDRVIELPSSNTVASDWTAILASSPGPPPPPASACTPRPSVRVTSVPDGPGRLRVTVQSTATAALPGNVLREVHLTALTNARVDVPGGVTDAAAPFVVPLGGGATSWTFFVRRATPGVATHVSVVPFDLCGSWPTFVGGGPGAF